MGFFLKQVIFFYQQTRVGELAGVGELQGIFRKHFKSGFFVRKLAVRRIEHLLDYESSALIVLEVFQYNQGYNIRVCHCRCARLYSS